MYIYYKILKYLILNLFKSEFYHIALYTFPCTSLSYITTLFNRSFCLSRTQYFYI